MPLESAEELERASQLCTVEHSHASVPATLLRVAWRPPETPLTSPRRSAVTPRKSDESQKRSDETQEICRVVTQQTAILMHHMTTLLSQQQEVLFNLLEEHSRSISHQHEGNMPQAAQTPEVRDGTYSKTSSLHKDEAVQGSPKRHEKGHEHRIHYLRHHSVHHTRQKKTNHEAFLHFAELKQKASEMTKEIPRSPTYLQTVARSMLKTKWYDLGMGAIIIFSCVLMIVEADLFAQCSREDEIQECVPQWIFTVHVVLLIVYTLEMLVVIDAYRWNTLRQADRMLEAFIVIMMYIDVVLSSLGEVFPGVEYLRLFRLTRLLRMSRLLEVFPELRYIMLGFVNAMRAMLWGFVLLLLILLAIAVVAVEIVRPQNVQIQHDSQQCAEAFDSVWNATLLFFQVIPAADNWGECMVPLIESNPLLFLFLGGSLITVQVGFLNLVMTVIIERVAEAREQDRKVRLHQKEKQINRSRKRWIEFFKQIDTDDGGSLSPEELLAGFDRVPDFKAELKLLGLERDDLPTLFNLLDEHNIGSVSRDQLLSMFDMIWNFDTRMHSVSMSMQLRTVFYQLEQSLHHVSHDLHQLELRLEEKSLLMTS